MLNYFRFVKNSNGDSDHLIQRRQKSGKYKQLEQNEASEIYSDPDSTDNDEEDWQKYEEKWKKYLKDSTFYEPPKVKPNEMEPGEVVENNAELIMEKNKIDQCHI